jgi:uncharacterized protein involved in propanediol utilization
MQLCETTPSGGIGRGRAFGTFGELLQGVGGNNRDFLVTLPISRFSTVQFLSIPHQSKLTVSPSQKCKAKQLATLILEHYRLPPGGVLELESNLPVGKGLASSSADLVAVARAIDDCFGLQIPIELLQHFLRQIEPTDGVMYEEIVAFYHRHVSLCKCLGLLPKLAIAGIDEGGEVNTIEFNRRPRHVSEGEKAEYDWLLEKITHAIRKQDLHSVGEIALRSAFLNQKYHKKRYFEQVRDICQQIGGLGVVAAHSGTYLGILLSTEDRHFYNQLAHVFEAMEHLAENVTLFHSWSPRGSHTELLHLAKSSSEHRT